MTTLTAIWTRNEMTAEDSRRWERALDLLAATGFVTASDLGRKWARRFVDLGLLRSAYGNGSQLMMTELGDELG